MAEFDIDQLKKTWQEQDKEQLYNKNEILEMLNLKSRNYVKYILWISMTEFLVFGILTLAYSIYGNETNSLLNLLTKIGLNPTQTIKADIAHINFIIKIISLLVTGIFVLIFYKNYSRINIEANLKQFILQIFRFKKTVRYFILTNVLLLVAFNLIIASIVYTYIQQQDLQLQVYNWWILVLTTVFTCIISIALIFIYYKILYGIILKKLSKNLKQLQEIENENSELV
ncbi:MAG: beta-carotene 15,15'-monooxygenase [Bacteroidetes bacterium]|nr:beta-carotene 15,15'-monooxygenase [Bacteroidota bacterium]